MARLFITPFTDVGVYSQRAGDPGAVPIPRNAQTPQRCTLGATSAQSAAFPAAARFLCLWTEEACAVTFGISPTVTVENEITIPAGVPVFLALPDGVADCKLAHVLVGAE